MMSDDATERNDPGYSVGGSDPTAIVAHRGEDESTDSVRLSQTSGASLAPTIIPPRSALARQRRATFGAVYCVYDDDRWLSDSVESIYPEADAIYFLVSDRPWNGVPANNLSTMNCIQALPDPDGKIRVIRGSWSTETEQRNAGLGVLKEAGIDYCLVIDADEIYDTDELGRMMSLAADRPEVGCWHVDLYTYWKSQHYRIEPREPYKPAIFARVGASRFTAYRQAAADTHAAIAPEIGLLHHMSYARSDDEIWRKITTFSHANEMLPGWFQNVWLGWDSDRFMLDLHPVHPQHYHMAILQPLSSMPPVLRRRCLGEERPVAQEGLTSIILVTHNRLELTRNCLEALRATTPEPHEVIVVDNASTDGTAEYLRQEEEAGRLRSIINPENLFFGKACNQAARVARGEYLLFLNNDTVPHVNWLGSLLPLAGQPGVGAVGSRLLYPDGTIQHAGIVFEAGHPVHIYRQKPSDHPPAMRGRDYPAITGACLMLRAEVFRSLGGFDEGYKMYVEDIDLCFRLWDAGLRLVYCPESVLTHFEGASNPSVRERDTNVLKGLEQFGRRWKGRIPRLLLELGLLSESSLGFETPVTRLEVVWSGNIIDFSGYARLSRDAIVGLATRDHTVRIDPFWADESFVAKMEEEPAVAAFYRGLLARRVAPDVHVCMHPPASWSGRDIFADARQQYPRAKAHVGITMFETDRLPRGWADACNGMDEVWVPSSFNRDTFIRAGVDSSKVRVIPFGIDTGAYDPAQTPPLFEIEGEKRYTFLSTFQWSPRKGWDVLLRAYLTAFGPEDPVRLVIRTYPGRDKTPPISERIEAFIRSMGLDPEAAPPILLLEDFVPDNQMPCLYASADAFVLPSRGEGWGIPYMEAMAMGLPVIGTRWSGHLDFMNDENCYLIDVEELACIGPDQTREDPYYSPDHLWAESSVRHTAELMRHLFESQEEAREVGARARAHIVEKWGIARTHEWIENRLSELASESGDSVREKEALSVLWAGALFDPSGYADEARNFVLALPARGIEPAVRAAGRHSDAFRRTMCPTARESLDAALARNPENGFVGVVHLPASAFRRLEGASYMIGRTMFETDSLPADWVASCNQMDEIWVPTDFNLDTFRRAGVTAKLVKVPGGIDAERFRPGLPPLVIPGARGKIFLSVFEWSYRKGWDVLLRAWAGAFGPDDDVTLVLRSYPTDAIDGDVGEEIHRRIDRFFAESLGKPRSEAAPIVVLGGAIPDSDMPRLYAAAHAYVAPSRGEGWGRPHMEAMACGLPVIATRWSGNLEFMNDTNSLLINIEGLVNADERAENSVYRGHRWAEPSTGHLVHLLRRAVREPEAMKAIGQQARRDVTESWTWSQAAAVAAKRLREIGAGTQPRLKVRWEGPQFAHHSLALVNREVCLDLVRRGHELSILPQGPAQFGVETDARFTELARRFGAALSGPATVHIRHAWPPDFTPPAEGHWVMIQPWEFGSIPKIWIDKLKDSVDAVWAYTDYVRRCYVVSGMPSELVEVVPLGVDTARFHPAATPRKLDTDKSFKFLFVGGTITRKGPDILLDAYLSAFTRSDDVCLVIKDMGGDSFYRGQTIGETIRKHQANPDGPEILYITDDLSPDEMPGLYAACDCLVHPYRGEGFGLPIVEAMASGLPVVVTGAGAALDYCDDRMGYLIPAKKQFITGQGNRIGSWATVDTPFWYEPDRAALASIMRRVFENPSEARARGELAAAHIARNFSWARAAEVAEQRLRDLVGRPIRRLQNELSVPASSPPFTVDLLLVSDGAPLPSLWPALTSAEAARVHLVLAEGAPEPPESLPHGWSVERRSTGPVRALNELLSVPGDTPVLLLSSDVTITSGTLERLTRPLRQLRGPAAVGPVAQTAPRPQRVKARYDGTGKELRRFAARRAEQYADDLTEVGYLGAFCVALSRRAFRTVGPFNEKLPLADALWDYFARTRQAGLSLAVAKGAYVHHERLSPDEGAGFDRKAEEDARTEREIRDLLDRGQAAVEREELEEAARAFRDLVDSQPQRPVGYAALASVRMAQGDVAAAADLLGRAIQIAPSALLHNQLGVVLFQAGKAEEAEASLLRARDMDGKDVQVLLNLIEIYRSRGDYNGATAILKEAAAVDPQNPEVTAAFGILSLELGDREGAEMAATSLESHAPEHPVLAAIRQALEDETSGLEEKADSQ